MALSNICMKNVCTLEEFLSFLKISCGFSFDMDKHTFGERIKLQKYVYMAIRMGLAPKGQLDYGMYIRGPYSSDLADIYFNMDSWRMPLFDQGGFDANRFISTVSHRDTRWLEIASSIIYICQDCLLRYSEELDLDLIYGKLSKLKDFSIEEVQEVYHNLCEKRLLDSGDDVKDSLTGTPLSH